MPKYDIVSTATGEVVGALETDLAPHMLLEGERSGKYQYRSPDAPMPEPDEAESDEAES